MLDWTRLTPAVEKAAAASLSSFPAHHDVSDVKQELWVWVMENKPTVLRVLSDPDLSVAALDALLTKAASSFLKKEDAASYGYREEDRFYYSIDLIKKILEVVFRHEDWQSFAMSQDTQPKAKSNPAQGGNNLASYADVSRAVSLLSDDHYNLVLWRYKYERTWAQVGQELGTTRQAAQQRHETALSAIQRTLGEMPLTELRRGFSERTEARSNAASQARAERDYEGG